MRIPLNSSVCYHGLPGSASKNIRLRLSVELTRLTWDGMAEPVSFDQILRRPQKWGNIRFSCSADREHDWHPYPVGFYSSIIGDHHSVVNLLGINPMSWGA